MSIDRYAKFISEQSRIAKLDEANNPNGWSAEKIEQLDKIRQHAIDDEHNEPGSMYAVKLRHADGRTAVAHFGTPSRVGGTSSAHRIITHSGELGHFPVGQEDFHPDGKHMLYGHIEGIEEPHPDHGISNEFGHTPHRLPNDSSNPEVNHVHEIALNALNTKKNASEKPKKNRFPFFK